MARENKRSIRWDNDVFEALEAASTETGKTMTAIANEAVRAYLDLDTDRRSLISIDRRLRAVEERLGMSAE